MQWETDGKVLCEGVLGALCPRMNPWQAVSFVWGSHDLEVVGFLPSSLWNLVRAKPHPLDDEPSIYSFPKTGEKLTS